MSEIITVRDSEVIAAEICAIKENTRRIMIVSSIAIGGKLMEAKSMVPYGEWGKWLEEKVSYSQSTANNMMQLYKEYGEGQANLFDNWTNSETFANLSYTQHMALLALPFSDRMDFAEKNDVEHMSTRELDKAIREELERTKELLRKREAELVEAEGNLDDARFDLQKSRSREQEIQAVSQDAQQKLKTAETDLARAEKSEKSALDLVAKLEKQVKDAKAKTEKAQKELKEARENPKLSEDAMAQLRKEAAAEEVQKATAKLEKDLAEAQKRASAATILAEEAQEKLEKAQKAVKTANPVITEAIVRAKKLAADFNELNGFRLKQQGTDPDTAEKIRKMMADMVNGWKEVLG